MCAAETVQRELLNTRSCFKHGYIFPRMNNSLHLRLEEEKRERCEMWWSEEEEDADKRKKKEEGEEEE